MSVRKLIVAVLVAGSLLGTAGTAHAATGMTIGAQDDAVFVSQAYFNRERAFQRLEQFHVRRLRVNVLWATIVNSPRSRTKPSSVRYDFTGLDNLILAARAHGIKLQLTLTTPAPAWAAGNHKVGPYKPNVKLFKEFVTAAATHFKGIIDRYSIINEGNLAPWLAPLKSGPKLYRKLYVAGYNTIKTIDPAAQVQIGETSPYGTRNRSTSPVTFLRAVLAGGPLKSDGYAHHPYDFQHKPNFKYPGKANATLGTIKNLIKELDRQAANGRLQTPGGQPLDVYVTEYGYLRAGRFGLSESRRAKYLRQAYDIALANPRIKQMLQFLLVEPGRKYKFFDMSLVSRKDKAGKAFDALVGWTTDHLGQLNANPNSPPPASGGGGGSQGGGGTPACGTPLPLCP
jgi:hypothetical protein